MNMAVPIRCLQHFLIIRPNRFQGVPETLTLRTFTVSGLRTMRWTTDEDLAVIVEMNKNKPDLLYNRS